MYQYGGLYIHCIAFKYDTFTGNDIWINFRCKFNSISNTSRASAIVFFSPYINTNGYSYIIDEKIYTDTTAVHDKWYMIAPFSYMDDPSTINYTTNLTLISKYNIGNGIKLNDLNTLTNFNNFSIHVQNNTFKYYMNGNYLDTRSGTHYKGFIVCYGIGSSSLAPTASECTIQNITLTDKMSSEIPHPPYTLDEKENELYGIQK